MTNIKGYDKECTPEQIKVMREELKDNDEMFPPECPEAWDNRTDSEIIQYFEEMEMKIPQLRECYWQCLCYQDNVHLRPTEGDGVRMCGMCCTTYHGRPSPTQDLMVAEGLA